MNQNEFSKAFFELTKNPDEIKEMSSSFKEGNIRITAYHIVPGIFLSLNEVTGSSIPFDENMYSYELTTINQCISGRCEFKHPHESVSYISPQLTCIAKKRKMNAFNYPLGYYTGLEISIIKKLITEETKDLLNCFFIDIETLLDRYLSSAYTYIGRTDSELLTLFNDLSLLVEKQNLGAIRLKVLEILSHLLREDMIIPADLHYLTSGQALAARRAHSILTADLSKHIAVKDIASSLGISETGLKNYFRNVYGSCISDYLKNKRMKYAADKLQNTSLSVLDIANSIGYSNQGRFAKIFFDFYNMNPLEYRRKYRTNP